MWMAHAETRHSSFQVVAETPEACQQAWKSGWAAWAKRTHADPDLGRQMWEAGDVVIVRLVPGTFMVDLETSLFPGWADGFTLVNADTIPWK